MSTDLVACEGPLEVAAVVSAALLEEPLVASGAVAVVVALGHRDEVVVQNLKYDIFNIQGVPSASGHGLG